MPLYAADGSVYITVVDGLSYVGAYASDGSLNVVLNNGSTYTGLHHPCGGLNLTKYTSGQPTLLAPNGSFYYSTTPYTSGTLKVTEATGSKLDNSWVVSGAVLDLDFVNQRYFFGGVQKFASQFATFSGHSFSSGLVLAGAARDISINFADTGLSTPMSLHVSKIPATVGTAQMAAGFDNDGTSNFFVVGNSTTSARVQTSTANVSQALIDKALSVALSTRVTVGGQYETNNILQSVNGATGGTADTSATLFVPTIFRIGERVGDSNLYNGTILRVTAFTGTKNQTQLNAENTLVHAT